MNHSGDIAILGIGGIFPGAEDVTQLWELIAAGRSVAREVPAGRWPLPAAEVFKPGAWSADHVYSTRACFAAPLREEALCAGLDPLFHLLVKAGRAAWTDAGMERSKFDPMRAGIIIGNIVLPTEAASAITDEVFTPLFERALGMKGGDAAHGKQKTDLRNRLVAGLPAGVLAEALGIRGPRFTLDAACASALYALKLAADELRAGRADVMITGGVSRPDSLYTQMGFAALGALSKSGRCAPFDAAADGLVVGEGAGLLVLKRVADAVRDGDRIYGTIAGAGLSNDVAGNLMLPDSGGQLRAMRAAYLQAGWDVTDVDMIECHGTGTPVGDGVELRSLRALRAGANSELRTQGSETKARGIESKPCVLGSVKSNVGHLLTAAGAAGLIKVLLGMRHGVLPATANFSAEARELAGSGFRVLRASERWERREDGRGRRAAVSGFGFGGINAHVLIEEWTQGEGHTQDEEQRRKTGVARSEQSEPGGMAGGAVGAGGHAAAAASTPAHGTQAGAQIGKAAGGIAIVGMGARFGPWKSLAEFERRVLDGDERSAASPRGWWGAQEARGARGFFVEEVKVPVGRYRIPPAELEEMLPQQLLMLEAAADAFADAGLGDAHDPRERLDTGVFLGIGLDLNTTNFRFRWTMAEKARAWRKKKSNDESGKDDGAPLPEEAFDEWVARLRAAAGPALNANRTMGALGGIVASRVARAFRVGGPSFTVSSEQTSGLTAVDVGMRALQRGEINVALVGAVDLAGDLRWGMDRADALLGEGAGALVLKRMEDAVRDGDRIYAVIPDNGLTHADATMDAPVMNALRDVGDAGAARGIAAVIKTALALYHEVLPGERGATDGPRYWLRDRANGPRRAVVREDSVDGNRISLRLEGVDSTADRRRSAHREQLILVRGGDRAELRANLERLHAMAAGRISFSALAAACLKELPARGQTVALVAESAEELRGLIAEAIDAVRAGRSLDGENIFYAVEPLAAAGGQVAFLYPGSGAQFAGMGRALAMTFPEILRRQDAESQRLASQFARGHFWESNWDAASSTAREVIFAQVCVGAFVTDVLFACGVKPQAVIGYSLGESTGLFSLRAWRDRDEMLRRIETSTLFTSDLTGPCDAARRAWGLAPHETVAWIVGVIDRPAAAVREALRRCEAAARPNGGPLRVYLLITHAPRECVIGGDRAAVDDFVREMGAVFHCVRGVTTVHCEIARPVEAAYRALHLLETQAPGGVRFYSAALGAAYPLTRESAAESIVRQALAPFDFTKVIEQAYADGVRLFVEVGPGASCTRMVDAVLHDRPHTARSVCVNGQEEVGTLLRVLAELAAHGVEINAEYLHGLSAEASPAHAPAKGREITVRAGGAAFDVPRPPTGQPRAAARAALRSVQPVETASTVAAHDAQALEGVMEQMAAAQAAHSGAQEVFLRLAENSASLLTEALSLQMAVLAGGGGGGGSAAEAGPWGDDPAFAASDEAASGAALAGNRPILDRDMCLRFAVGRVGDVLGDAFAHVDAYPTRVRLPDEPLMLVDRITRIDGEANALLKYAHAAGRVITEHDIHDGAWYLDGGKIPVCIAVEAGQADLFLSGYLGIDSITRGGAVYRLLDAVVTFHDALPGPGERIVYDIVIEEFFRQGATYLFRFHFDATVNGRKFLTMRKGCAGFFTAEELASGQGIVLTTFDKRPAAGQRPDWTELVPMAAESYDDRQLEALRRGDLAACFGEAFAGLALTNPATLPGGRMTLVHRILSLDPSAGRFGLGQVVGEADIRPDDWFLTCHFVDDRVMPGTLMYECCLHTLRVYLMRMGWIGETSTVAHEPIPGAASVLKCRGQVTAATKQVRYEITLKEIGYQEDGTPYVVADALMHGDGKAIVQMGNMSVRLTGLTKAGLEALWQKTNDERRTTKSPALAMPLFDTDRITAFAIGKPSEAFGAPYRMFDPGEPRKIARLPGPPYQFLDRVTLIENCTAFKLAAGGIIEAEYDVPADAWYFAASQQHSRGEMPFAVLLEIALQPCGWLAAFLGSALVSDTDMRFRNLGGTATQLLPVTPTIGTLTTRIKITNVSHSGGMLIQHFGMAVRSARGEVYRGTTYFGFFSKDALANQLGIREAALYAPTPAEIARAQSFAYPTDPPFPGAMMRMVDQVELFVADGGPKGLGFIRGTTNVDATAWFFKAHFFEDPVWPGSLGLESFVQLLKVLAARRWGGDGALVFETIARGEKHSWIYRGQILPADRRVTIEAAITAIDDEHHLIRADGFLTVDGRVIYQMKDFALRLHA